jgi:hypothetical protein
MPKKLRILIYGILLGAAGFAAVTWIALESQEVVVLRTVKPGGSTRTTRVWVASEEESLWLESATPERRWYRDIVDDPDVEVELDGRILRFEAHPVEGAHGHRKIRSLLRAKYGWADAWVGIIQDTSRSIAVRLDPASA